VGLSAGVGCACFMWAYRQGDLNTKPDVDRWIEIKRNAPKRIMTLGSKQQAEILPKMKKEHPIFLWLFETGERMKAARAKKVGDINLFTMEYYHGGAFSYHNGQEIYKPFPKVRDRAADANPITPKLEAITQSALAGLENAGPDE